jgi:alpha-tubulin suppressor-like RCC1 family protein
MPTAPAVGSSHTCAEGSNGKAYCGGYNAHGRLGDGTTTDRLTPVGVAGTRGE